MADERAIVSACTSLEFSALAVYAQNIKKAKTRSVGKTLFDKDSLQHKTLCTTNLPGPKCIS